MAGIEETNSKYLTKKKKNQLEKLTHKVTGVEYWKHLTVLKIWGSETVGDCGVDPFLPQTLLDF